MIRNERPPNWDEVVKVFDVIGKPVIFSWGEDIFNPMGVKIGNPLLMHESVHGVRQMKYDGGIEAWWQRYLAEPSFRVTEEIPAHAMEYWKYCRTHFSNDKRRTFLREITQRLSGPLYGSIITYRDAELAIVAGANNG